MRAFSNKSGLNLFCEKKNETFTLVSIDKLRLFSSGVINKNFFYHTLNLWHRTTYHESFIKFARLDFC